MIFGKINPVATKVVQQTPFTTTTITADTMTAIARPYRLGENQTRFEVIFGNVTNNNNNNEINFNFTPVINSEVTLNSTQLSNWGQDDSVVLNLIAGTLGTNIVSVFSGKTNNIF